MKMRIKEKLSQNRRDFQAIYECEHCGETLKSDGYDDVNFHKNVIPSMKCKSCGKSAPEDYKPMETRYPEGMQV
jgi:transcription elongation factor Elf1